VSWSQLQGIVSYISALLVFLLFLLVTCTTLAARKPSPQVYLVFFFGLLLWSGLSGRILWPFHPWGLWGVIQPTEKVYYELEVADARGNRLRYDQNAARPILPTQLHQLGEVFIESQSAPRREQLGRFLLSRANAYREKRLSDGDFSTWAKFPGREFGTTWTQSDLAACGPFTHIVASKRHAELPAAGPGGPIVTIIAEGSWP
jgi:hypothetical protein